MKNKAWKSIRAVVIGIIVGAVLSTVTDKIFEATGVLPKDNLYVSAWLIWIVLLYRSLYQIIACYIIAKLAPQKPMKHVIVAGSIGFMLCLLGVIANYKFNLGPAWYAWTLAILALPTAWLGGKLYLTHYGKRK